MKITVLAHPEKEWAQRRVEAIEKRLKIGGHEIVPPFLEADLLIALGGDGYMVHCVGNYSVRKIPCIGINAGDVGFLTNGNINDCNEVLDRIVAGDFRIEERVGLELVYDGKSYGPFVNDVYLRHPFSIASFKVELDGEALHEVGGDGIIVSTATGSTGYNAAARGPIVQPGVSCLLLTPICSGHLNSVPLVLNPTTTVRISIAKSKGNGYVALMADGKKIADVPSSAEIIVKQHEVRLLFAVISRHDFYRALQDKKGLMK